MRHATKLVNKERKIQKMAFLCAATKPKNPVNRKRKYYMSAHGVHRMIWLSADIIPRIGAQNFKETSTKPRDNDFSRQLLGALKHYTTSMIMIMIMMSKFFNFCS